MHEQVPSTGANYVFIVLVYLFNDDTTLFLFFSIQNPIK